MHISAIILRLKVATSMGPEEIQLTSRRHCDPKSDSDGIAPP